MLGEQIEKCLVLRMNAWLFVVVLRIATCTECKLMNIKLIAIQRNIVGNIMVGNS